MADSPVAPPILDAETLAELRRLLAEEAAALAACEAQPGPRPFGRLDRAHDRAQAAVLEALWPHRLALVEAASSRSPYTPVVAGFCMDCGDSLPGPTQIGRCDGCAEQERADG